MPVLVVAAAIVDGDRVLAARRSAPAALAGGWEFPGGKVEPGEDEAAALARECAEELGIVIAVGVPVASARSAAIELRLWSARLVDGSPRALADHDELRWLGIRELADLPWLALDRELLPAVETLLV